MLLYDFGRKLFYMRCTYAIVLNLRQHPTVHPTNAYTKPVLIFRHYEFLVAKNSHMLSKLNAQSSHQNLSAQCTLDTNLMSKATAFTVRTRKRSLSVAMLSS